MSEPSAFHVALTLFAGAFVLAGVECALISTRRAFSIRRNLLNLCATTIVMGTLFAALLLYPGQGWCKTIQLSELAVAGTIIALPPCGIGFTVTFAIQRAMLDIQRKRRTREDATQSASSR